MLVNILLLLLILLRFVIGVRLIVLTRQNNLPNIYWLASLFFAVAIGAFFAPSMGNPLGNLPISLWMFTGVGSIVPLALVIAFNHTTFYQGRKSPIGWYAGFCAIIAVITAYGLIHSESNYNQNAFVAYASFGLIIVWAWHGWSAYQALTSLSNEQTVGDWIKSRYMLIILYSAVLIIAAIGSFIRVFYAGGSNLTPLGNAMGILALITQITAVSLQFLVWVMPLAFRNWLNRNQQTRTEAKLREQALVILDILGSAMSEGTGLSKLVAIFSIRKIIGQQINLGDSNKIEDHAITLGYNEWLDLLNNPEFYNLIENSPATASAREIIDRAKRALAEKQSLFTMQAK